MQRGAAGVWFPAIKSALSIPPWSNQIFANIPNSDLNNIKDNLKMDSSVLPDKPAWLKAFLQEKPYVTESPLSLEEFVDVIMGLHTESTENAPTDLTMRMDEN